MNKAKKPDCPFCKSKKQKVCITSPKKNPRLFSATSQSVSGEKLYKCLNCDLVYVYPIPKNKQLLEGYQKGIETSYVEDAVGRLKTFQQSIKKIKKYKLKGRLLDVGCAAGFFLKAAKENGFQAEGIEPNKWMARWGQKNLSVRINNGNFETYQFKKQFEVITFWDVLEHLAEPKKALIKTRKLLCRNGIILINYPNIDSFCARLLGKRWWFVVSGHLFYFSPKTIKDILESSGFKVLEDKSHIQTLSFSYLLSRLGRYNKNLASRLSTIAKSLGFSHFLIPYYAGQNTTIAIKKTDYP